MKIFTDKSNKKRVDFLVDLSEKFFISSRYQYAWSGRCYVFIT